MYVKLDTALWALIFAVVAGLAATGNFTTLTAIVFGFISFGMVFMGMTSVLPSIVSTAEGRASLCESKGPKGKQAHAVSEEIRHGAYDWFFPRGVEISPPKRH